jgi:hypothetical protein
MTLPIIATVVTRQYNFLTTVTVLQHRNRRDSELPPEIRESESTGDRVAKELGNCWRFFPTYAEVQTGSVLSTHPRMRDDEC